MMSRLKPRRTNLIYEMGSFQPWINVQCLADFGRAGVSPPFFQCGKIRKITGKMLELPHIIFTRLFSYNNSNSCCEVQAGN
jgi:hypothetical protein